MVGEKKEQKFGGWSGLVCDLLDQIKSRLPLKDLVCFNCVCTSWRSVSASQVQQMNRMPWLIVPFHVDHTCPPDKHHNYCHDGVLGFFSILDGVTYKVEIPELYERRICGASHGWLVTIHGNSEMQLLHPFTRKILQLPSFTKFPFVKVFKDPQEKELLYLIAGSGRRAIGMIWGETCDQMRDSNIYKAIIDVRPNSTSRPVVVCISSNLPDFYFCVQGEETWRRIDCGYKQYSDIANYKGDLYVITLFGEVDVVRGFDVLSQTTTLVSLVREDYNHYETSNYLVATCTELLQVVRFYSDWLQRYMIEERYRFTERFKVFKLDFSVRKWVEVKSLGDMALFVGFNESFSVIASDFFPGCKGNCIYFSDNSKHKGFRGHDKGIFSLDDHSVEKISPIDSMYICPRPLWYSADP